MASYVGPQRTVDERLRKDEFQEESTRRKEANRSPLKTNSRPIAIQQKELKKSDKTDVKITRVKDRDS